MVYALDISQRFEPAKRFGTVGGIVNTVVPILTGIAAMLFVVMAFYGVFTIITSGGDPERVKKAQKIFQYSVIGLVIVIAAFAIVRVIGVILKVDVPL